MVHDAGITTTGQASNDNELPALAKEFSEYRKTTKVWQNLSIVRYEYFAKDDGSIIRKSLAEEEILTW